MFSQAFSAMPCSPLASHPASPHTQLSWQSFDSIAPSQHHCPTQAPYSSPWWVERDFSVLEILPRGSSLPDQLQISHIPTSSQGPALAMRKMRIRGKKEKQQKVKCP